MRRPLDPAKVYAEYHEYIWRVLHRLGIPAQQAEDLMQEVFVQILRSPEAPRDPRAWLWKVCISVVAKKHAPRQARQRREVPLEDESPDMIDRSPDPETRMAESEGHELLRRLLEQLPLERRAVVAMYELEELPVQTIAETLGISQKAVYHRLEKGRQELEEAARREQRRRPKTGHFTVIGLINAGRAGPAMPDSTEERVRARLTAALPADGVPIRAAARALGRPAIRHGLTFLAGAGAGAIAHALLGGAFSPPHEQAPLAIVQGSTRAIEETPVDASPAAPLEATSTRSAGPASPVAGPRPNLPAVATADPDDRGLIVRARRAFAHGDTAAALAALNEHARRFPSSQFSTERATLRDQANRP